ncbi:hypothetical protein B296_00030413 [Ensete ventricosum]|uniref:Uncharacterized protein n=1 Tax=Ensete ventricosum TaxID=4639 RepID=A0A426ZLR6_ENSVE|nr:hypothetical protein B296_00030413 [Ensete ventricosum]
MWLAPWRVPQHLAVKIRVIIAAMAGIDVQRIPSPISIMSWECNSIPWVSEVMKEPRNQDCDARAPNKEKWSRLQWGSPHRGHCPSVLEVVVSRLASQVGDASAKRWSEEEKPEAAPRGGREGEGTNGGCAVPWLAIELHRFRGGRDCHEENIPQLQNPNFRAENSEKKTEFLEENFQELFQKNKLSQNIKKKVLTLARDREASMRCRRITAMAPVETGGNLKARTPRDDACGHGSWIPSHRSRVLARLLKTQFDHETGV